MKVEESLFNLGQGLFVSDAALRRMKKNAINDIVKDMVAEGMKDFGLEDAIKDMLQASIDEIAIASKKQMHKKTLEHIDRLRQETISTLINQAINDAILAELSRAGLDRHANALVWAAINVMRKAAMQT